MAAALRAGLFYVLLMFAAGFALGTLRVLVLLPLMGELPAVALELPVMLALSWVVAGWLIRRMAVPHSSGARLAMGGLAFALLMVAEMALAVGVFGRSLPEHMAHYATWPGALGLVGQVGFALIPLLRLRA